MSEAKHEAPAEGAGAKKHLPECWGSTSFSDEVAHCYCKEGQEDTDALLPCPFCGGDAEIIHIEDGENEGGSCVCCAVCQASGNVEFGRKENFVSNWNRRARSSAPVVEMFNPAEGSPATRLQMGMIIADRDAERDYPGEFEIWWSDYRHSNRALAGYSTKKQIAFDAFYHGARSSAPEDREPKLDDGFEAWLNDRNLLPHGAWDWPSIIAMLSHHEDALAAPEAREEVLGNLLAVIHGDGGHRALEVGTKQAALEAEKIVAGLFAAPSADKLRIAVEALEPFSKAFRGLSARWEDHETHWHDSGETIKVSDLRSASEAFASLETEGVK